MKATGIVRRMDDIGRVVIPKEIRKSLGIQPGDPLEIFVTHEGEVLFRKYHPYTEREWGKAKSVVSHLVKGQFELLDRYECVQAGCYNEYPFNPAKRFPIEVDGDVEGYLVVSAETASDISDDMLTVAAAMVAEMFEQEG